MAIVAECAVCGKRFKAAESQAGKKAKCSQCGTVFVIAQAGAASEAESKVGALAPAKSFAKSVQSVPRTTPAKTVAATKMVAPTNVMPTQVAAKANTTSPPKPAAPSKPVTAPKTVTPTKVTASRARAATAEPKTSPLSPEIKAASSAPPDSRVTAVGATISSATMGDPAIVAPLTNTGAQAAPPPRKSALKIIVLVIVLLGGIGAAILYGPRLFPKPPSQIAGKGGPSLNNAQTVSHVITPSLPPTGPAWSASPDGDKDAKILKLPDDFRLAIPAQPPLRHNPSSLVLAPAPSPFIAVTLLPNADRSQPTIEVWNLYTKSKTAQFKLNQPLTNAILSQDGGYYAGQFYDQDARATRVELWATSSGTRVHTIDIPSASPISARAVLGFPMEDQMALLGDKLQVWNIASKKVVREVQLPARSPDTCAAASSKLKLVAVADSKSLMLVDVAGAKVLGTEIIPEALVAHPRHRLSLKAIEFSPDGAELGLLFDNQQSTRRIGIFDVATGTLKALHTPIVSIQSGGPEFAWTGDSQAFLMGSGVLLDRAAGRQIGQIYTEIPDEGLGGALSALLADDHALAVWDKYPNSLVLRSLAFGREKPDWISVNIKSAVAKRYEQLQCVAREFGNLSSVQSLYQSGRLTDASQFLVVDARFTASLSDEAPRTMKLASLRPDRFVLIADGHAHLPIGSIGSDGDFSLEKPQADLRRNDSNTRTRSLVFSVSGHEKSLALQIGPAVISLEVPQTASIQPPPSLSGVGWDQLSMSAFAAPDDTAQVSVKITSARIGPYDLDPEAAEHMCPFRVTYSTAGANMMAVTFDLTVNTARNFTRTSSQKNPRLGLLLPDGTNIRPAIELPDVLPVSLGAGERRTHTCLFIFNSPATKFRLTYDGAPVATIVPEGSTAQSTP